MQIVLNSDFFTFNKQMIKKHGKHYSTQTDLFFERACLLAEKGLLYSAIQDAKFALSLNEFSKDQNEKHFIIGFIAQLYCDLGKIKVAKHYYELGLKLLDKLDADYWDDFQIYQRLKEQIDSDGWKGNS
jgi:tetratricopeptide (TPR) repeat protein